MKKLFIHFILFILLKDSSLSGLIGMSGIKYIWNESKEWQKCILNRTVIIMNSNVVAISR